MRALRKFRLLATKCVAASTPPRSPAAGGGAERSCHFRRQRTPNKLHKLLSLRRFLCRENRSGGDSSELGEKKSLLSHSLKDLFSSSPPPSEGEEEVNWGDGGGGVELETGRGSLARMWGFEGRSGGGARRFGSVARLRDRLLRKAWRPVLVAIPE
uniref:Uncharacterized protein LOC105041261 n=2 Tax=Elaeis guineensis var. tenera TaxID=51953 RepID=A0A8N4IF67_ELAGV|nr:uncharacterized protein LOC105041261 [Elaeis guineensis]